MLVIKNIRVRYLEFFFCPRMSAVEQTQECLNELRRVLEDFNRAEETSPAKQASSKKVKHALIKLRRSHASLRQQEMAEQKQIIEVMKSLQRVKFAIDNSKFLESQCEFLVEKFNSAQCPELEKVMPSLPSIAEYTARHEGEPGFVSYDTDPHQFMLNILASELEERERMEEMIKELEQKKTVVTKDISKKREFLSSLTCKIQDLSQAMDGLTKLFEKQ